MNFFIYLTIDSIYAKEMMCAKPYNGLVIIREELENALFDYYKDMQNGL